MTTVRQVAVLCLFVVFLSCRQEEATLAPNVASLVGTWQLSDPSSAYNITLTFALDTANPPKDVTPFKANGKSSVNQYNAFLSAAVDGLLIIVNLSSSQLAGSATATKYENAYFDGLRSVVRFELTDSNRLLLFHGGSTPGVLIYKRVY